MIKRKPYEVTLARDDFWSRAKALVWAAITHPLQSTVIRVPLSAEARGVPQLRVNVMKSEEAMGRITQPPGGNEASIPRWFNVLLLVVIFMVIGALILLIIITWKDNPSEQSSKIVDICDWIIRTGFPGLVGLIIGSSSRQLSG